MKPCTQLNQMWRAEIPGSACSEYYYDNRCGKFVHSKPEKRATCLMLARRGPMLETRYMAVIL